MEEFIDIFLLVWFGSGIWTGHSTGYIRVVPMTSTLVSVHVDNNPDERTLLGDLNDSLQYHGHQKTVI